MKLRQSWLLRLGVIAFVCLCSLSASARGIGPDNFGYRASDEVPFLWEALSPAEGGSGANVITQNDWTGNSDDGSVEIPIGFDFRFYGNTKTNLFISSNGFLTFDSAGSRQFVNRPIPTNTVPNDLVALFWDDLDPGNIDTNLYPNDGLVYYQTFGSTPDRRLVVEYYKIPHISDVSSRYTMAVTLYEASGAMKFQYLNMQNGVTNYGDGRTATIGIETNDGEGGLEWSYDTVDAISNGMAIWWWPYEADIVVDKTVSNATPVIGDTVYFTLTVSNTGPGDIYSLVVTDTVPTGLGMPWNIMYTKGIYSSYRWMIWDLPAGSNATLWMSGRAVNIPFTNYAKQVSFQPGDMNPSNDQAEVGVVPQVIYKVLGFPENHDSPLPFGYGTNLVAWNSIITNSVTSPTDTSNGTHWVVQGSNPRVDQAFTNMTLAWWWEKEYYLSLSGNNGSIVGATSGWKAVTSVHTLTPSNSIAGYTFQNWVTNGVPTGSNIPLVVTMDEPKQVNAVFQSDFKDVTGETTTSFYEWRLNRQTGTYFGDMTFCNKATSTRALLGPYWYEVQPSTEYYLMNPDGINPDDGLPYVDITDQVNAQLPDGKMDPGECVVVTNIEIYFRTRVPVVGMVQAVWADPPGESDGDKADVPRDMPFNDYNGDGLSDLAVYDLTAGDWYIRSLGPVGPENPPITFGQNWGGAGFDPVIGDYNADGLSDLAVYDSISGSWYIRSLGPVGPENPPITFGQDWGGGGLIAVPGDYDGDKVYDLAVYDPATGDWYIRSLGPIGPANAPIVFGQNWGGAGMTPVPGDYNGDGLFDLAVYDRATGSWFVRSLGAGDPLTFGEAWGSATAIPVPGDYNGDGRFDLAYYEPATGQWFIKSLGGTIPITVDEQWGGPGLMPVPGDYNNDGVYDLAVYEVATGNWYIRALGDTVSISFGQNWGGANFDPVGGRE